MIQQTPLVKKAYSKQTKFVEKLSESLSIPGQGFNLKLAMEQYKRGTLVERVKGYYENHGMVSPDFGMMDRIGKLHALSEFRTMRKVAEKKLDSAYDKANKKYKEDVLEKTKAKAGGKTDSEDTPKSV